MLTLPPSTRIFVAVEPSDMRKSFDGLSALVERVIGESPLSGHLFCFTNRRRNRLKILYWDGSGLCVLAKRLEKGTFAWPSSPEAKRVIRADELATLIGGLDLDRAKPRAWYRREC